MQKTSSIVALMGPLFNHFSALVNQFKFITAFIPYGSTHHQAGPKLIKAALN